MQHADAMVPRGPVLVTGASSGLGRHVVGELSRLGVRAYATARRSQDLAELSRLPGVVPVEMDVRRSDQVEAARRLIEAEGGGLAGLVNNAGVGGLGPLASWDDDDLRDIFDVNVFGPHRVTRALAPLLVAGRGRIVNVGSQGGMLSMGGFGPYTMTKHALEAFTTALAEEMAPHGVTVSIVQPGGFVSSIVESSRPGTQARLERTPPPFDDDARRFLEALRGPFEPRPDEPESAANRKPSPTSLVADAVLDALFSAHPRRRYLVGTRWEGERVVRALLERLVEADECPALALSRDELVARLDAAIEQRDAVPALRRDDEDPRARGR